MKRLLFVGLLLCISSMVMAQESAPKKILFIGNSYTEYNNLPEIVKQAMASTGHEIEYEKVTPGGAKFSDHCFGEGMRQIKAGIWDFVVLQEQSQMPAFPQDQIEVECLPFAKALVDSIYSCNPNAEAMFYMTWGRKYGDQQNGSIFPPIATYEGMDSLICERYMYMGLHYGASVCPVGRVWRYIRTNHPDIELYQSDNSHPTVAGSYAAACAFYTMFTQDDPNNITFDNGLEAETAATIREVAHTVVYDDYETWMRHPIPVSIDGVKNMKIACYPNPTCDKVNVDGSFIITDAMGRTMTKGENQADLSTYPNGLYLMQVYQNGKYMGTAKIMKASH